MKALMLVMALLSSSQLQAASFELEASGSEPLYQTTLSKAVYQASRSDTLQDLTMHNAAGEQVPYALLAYESLHPTQTVEESKPLVIFPMQERELHANGSIHVQLEKSATTVNVSGGELLKQHQTLFLFDLGKEHEPLNKLKLDWQGAENKFIHVEALGSDDLKDWISLGYAVLLKANGEGQAILKNTVSFNHATQARYLQIRLVEPDDGFKLSSVSTEYSKTQTLALPYLWQDLKFLNRTQIDQGEINIDFESLGRYPASQIKIALPQQNTITSVRILVRNNTDAPWREISYASLYRLSKQGTESINPDTVINSTVARYWRLQFSQASGGLGAENPKLTLGWLPQTLVWNARGQAPYRLTLGETSTVVNAVNIASLIPDYSIEKVQALPQANLRTQDNMPSAVNAWESATDYKRYLLWAGLGLGVLLLAGMVRTLLKDKAS